MILFSFQFLLTNIIFSVVICAAVIRFDNKKAHSNSELFLYSLGLGPIFTSLLLYYLLLFTPHQPYLYYFLVVLTVYLLLSLIGRKYFSVLWIEVANKVKSTKKKFKNLNTHHRVEFIVFSSTIIVFLALFLYLYSSNTLQTPLDETDALKYGTLGKILFKEKSLEYRWIRTNPKTGFYLITNHAPSFALFLTWEKIMDSFSKADKDLYFKSVSAYFTLLAMAAFVFWLSRKSKYLSLLGLFALFSGVSFFRSLIIQNLDTYRVFFLIISWIFLAYSIEKKEFLSISLLGVFSGFTAFAHTIGAILVIFNCIVFFFFIKGNLKNKIIKTSYIIILIIVCGGFHYILDTLWGFGWVIFDRQITWWG